MSSLDTPEFHKFQAKREQWIECLSGDDQHSVTRQIWTILWNAAAFRVINEARRIAVPTDDGDIPLNGMMHKLINDGFFISQAVAIRRLTDTYPIGGAKGVYSLTGLLDDMKSSAFLMTREHLFAAEGLEYEYEHIKQAAVQYCVDQARAGKTAYFFPEHLAWERHEDRHGAIDTLAGVQPENRLQTDPVRPEVFDVLKKKIKDTCSNVSRHVNTFIAHAATPDSRGDVHPDEVAVTLGHLWDAHEAICKVVNFVSVHVLYGATYGGLPVPQYNQFKHIEKPLVAKQNVQQLVKVWQDYEHETQNWGLWSLDEFENEMKQFRECGG